MWLVNPEVQRAGVQPARPNFYLLPPLPTVLQEVCAATSAVLFEKMLTELCESL